MENEVIDVAVIGSGNAALLAALSAQESGSRVSIFEASTEEAMGGNSRFTFGGFRFGISDPEDIKALIPNISTEELQLVKEQPYSSQDFYNHLMSTSHDTADKSLCQLLANTSFDVLKWMRKLGVEWDLCISKVPSEPLWKLSPGSVFVKGRGKGLIQQLLQEVHAKEITIHYNAALEKIIADKDKKVIGIQVKKDQKIQTISCSSVILACGGFEANKPMRKKYMGENWANMKVRGTRYNRGKGLKAALAIGAQPYGNWSGGHAVPINAKAEDFGVLALGETTRRCLFQYGISINNDGRRFMDEGENKKVLMYGKTGLEVSKQNQNYAFQIFDAKIMTSNFEKLFYFSGNYFVANTLEELADHMKVPKEAFLQEIQNYNHAIDTSKPFDTAILDDRHTNGITPVRSNYADPIQMPPFFAFSVAGGITFTYGGIKINTNAEVLDQDDQPIQGLYAAGEMTGGFFMDSYPANAGLARGAVTGYLAGKSAARYLNAIGMQ